MKAVQFIKSVPRWLLVRSLGNSIPSLPTGALSCIQYKDIAEPNLPADDWVVVKPRLSGICGSDLSTIRCKGSPYFSPFTSTPFVLGHETVGEVVSAGPKVDKKFTPGTRVVLEPALGCTARGIEQTCEPCTDGRYPHCENILNGTIDAGIQTGYCGSTGGTWSEQFVAHESQLYAVSDDIADDVAVLAEPYCCSLHCALKIPKEENKTILVIGCGTIGLLTIAAYRFAGGKGKIWAVARYSHQEEFARKLGADEVCRARNYGELYKWSMEKTGATLHKPEIGKPVLLGGIDTVVDCVGSSDSLDDSLRLAKSNGLVIVSGMPGIPSGIDWTGLWYKELQVVGSYTYGWENHDGRKVKTMDLTLEHLASRQKDLKPLVNKRFPLSQYKAALDAAFFAGRKGAFKVVFDLSK